EVPKAKAGDYLLTVLLVTALLVIAWFMEAGNEAARLVFVAISVVVAVWGRILVRKAKNGEDDTKP
ncbi:MAG: hypothetical protein AAGE85_13890, partial [Pseudomonadota bacterium]